MLKIHHHYSTGNKIAEVTSHSGKLKEKFAVSEARSENGWMDG